MPKLSCVLLVDDDATTNYLNQLLLKRMDVADQLLVALNGQEALALLHQHGPPPQALSPVLILLDVKMPVMDGFAFLEAFNQLPARYRQAVVVVMLSTSLHPRDVARAQLFGIGSFLSKPLTADKVNEVLQAHFGA